MHATLSLSVLFCSLSVAQTPPVVAPPVRVEKEISDANQKADAESAVVDPALAKYQRVAGLTGNLDSIGSDTLNNLMTFWAEGFRRLYPNVRIQIEGKGSSTAPPALIAGTAQLGPMSRAMKPSEIDEFEKKFGYKPTQLRVAIDALAVYVHRDNPLEHLTLPEVDAIFSKTRKGGVANDITAWDQLGLATPDWQGQPIRCYGRDSASGTYQFFKDVALYKGDYKDNVKEQKGSASVINSIGADRLGIGYSGIGYKTSEVKTLALAVKDGGAYFDTDTDTVLAGKYPLTRFLYVYVNKAPNRPLDPLVKEFLSYVLSREGQVIVVKDGYVPLTSRVAGTVLGAVQ
jgi:phosphate transport system substrate-binding protein